MRKTQFSVHNENEKENNKILRSAIIGCGKIAGGYDLEKKRKGVNTHAKAYEIESNTELVAVADVDVEKAKIFSNQWRVKNYYQDFEDMISEQRPDLVSICSPDETHAEILFKLLDFECIKGVWCEKPITTDVDEAEIIVKAYKEKNITLATNYLRRWDNRYQAVGLAIKNGKLGRIQKVIAFYTKGICHNGSHAIDLFLDWFGSLKEAYVFSGHVDFSIQDPTIDANITLGKTPIFLIGLDERKYTIFEIDILGTNGRIRITREGFDWYNIHEYPGYEGYQMLRRENDKIPKLDKDAMCVALVDIIHSVRYGKTVCSNGETSLEALRLCKKLTSMLAMKPRNCFRSC